jgi:TM2 domain-containing membrane protein YozV
MQCPNCEATISEGSGFCNNCGYDLRPRAAAPQSQQQVVYVKAAKDPSTALLIEMVGAFFGLMGLGWLYAGYTNRGVILLLVWLGVVIVAAIVTALTAGIFACLWLPVQIAAAVVSGLMVKQAVEQDTQRR